MMRDVLTALRAIGSLFIHYKLGAKDVAGVEMNIDWGDGNELVYASFSVNPEETSHFDFYGVPDDEIFYYFEESFREFFRHIFTRHSDGWKIVDARFTYL